MTSSKVIHFSRKELNDCSRMQAQTELDDGECFLLKSYFSLWEPLTFIKKLTKRLPHEDLVLVFHQQRTLLILLLCYLFGRSKNVHFVYDMHDLNELRVSYGTISRFKDRVFYSISYLLEWLIARLPISVITVSRGLSRIFYSRYKKSCTLFYNMPSLSLKLVSQARVQDKSSSIEKVKVCYFGVLKDARIPRNLLNDLIKRDVIVDIYGTVDPVFKPQLEKMRLFEHPNIFYQGRYSGADIITTLIQHDYDYSLCVFNVNTVNLRFSMPNKAFQSLFAGIPVLCSPQLKEVLFTFNKFGGAKKYPQSHEVLEKTQIDRTRLFESLNRMYSENRNRYLNALKKEFKPHD